jgi:hypothetical protein
MTFALDLAFDPRWRRLHDPGFVCPACGQRHGGLPEFNLEKPFQWQGGEKQDASSPDIDPRNYLLEDFCVIGNRAFFLRGVILLPIRGGAGRTLAFSAWVEVPARDFDRYGDSFAAPDQSKMGPMAGRLANLIGGFPDTLGLSCALSPQDGGLRPLIGLDAEGHPLAAAQRDGVTLEQALDFLAAVGHDLRPGLRVVN